MPGPNEKYCTSCRGNGYLQDRECDSNGYWYNVGPEKKCRLCGGSGIIDIPKDERPESAENWFGKKMKKLDSLD